MTPRGHAIAMLKRAWWTPAKIQRLLGAAAARGVNPVVAADEALIADVIAELRPAARRYIAELKREKTT